MRPLFVDPGPFHISYYNFFLIDGTFCNDFPVWPANKALAPKFNSLAASGRFMAHAIRNSNVAAIRDGVTPLDRFPCGVLRFTKVFLFRGMPANGCRVKNNFRSPQRSEARRFRVPLVPTYAHPDVAGRCLPCLKSEIAGSEIKFLLIQR